MYFLKLTSLLTLSIKHAKMEEELIQQVLEFMLEEEQSVVTTEVWIELASLPNGKSPVSNNPPDLQTEDEEDSFSDDESDGEPEIYTCDFDEFIKK
jgi:hypothetical protein